MLKYEGFVVPFQSQNLATEVAFVAEIETVAHFIVQQVELQKMMLTGPFQ